MSQARFIVGDALEELRKMPDASVDLALSSPPFLALRSYLPSDDFRKPQEMGSEATPGEFIDRLLEVIEECRRVLAPHGSLVLELGDTYAGSGGAGGDYGPDGMRQGQPRFRAGYLRDDGRKNGQARATGEDAYPGRKGGGSGWPLEKSLTLVPELLRISLVYGFNPLTGRETPRWRIRNVVRWVRPNPPVGALADKFRPATSDFVVACMSRKRYFDMEAVRLPSDSVGGSTGRKHLPGDNRKFELGPLPNTGSHPGGAPPLDWLQVSTEPYKGAHYASWPKRVVLPFIESMCPRKVCEECGKPSERLVEGNYAYDARTGKREFDRTGAGRQHTTPSPETTIKTLGFTDCGHNAWRRGLVLDPFAGSGVTLAVAVGLGRDAIGIDLDERNLDLARERVGMFLEVAT